VAGPWDASWIRIRGRSLLLGRDCHRGDASLLATQERERLFLWVLRLALLLVGSSSRNITLPLASVQQLNNLWLGFDGQHIGCTKR